MGNFEMNRLSTLAASAAFALAITGSAGSAFASDQTDLLRSATRTVDDLKHDPSFAQAQQMLRHARAVLIIPHLVKGGFIFGAEGGDGVLLERRGSHWSEPSFYTMGSASFGLQAGLEEAHIVLLIMSDRALRGIEESKFKIGAGAGLTVVTLSAGAEGATSGNLSGDIVVWTSATGAYGGLTLNGSVVDAKRDWNDSFYGRPASVNDIMHDRVHNPETKYLRSDLSSAM
jgi:lipid-binding SYLF domain-containing protein